MRQERRRRHDHARRAVAALRRLFCDERTLKNVYLALVRQAFDRGDAP
jgi:hypothetical protein